VQEHGLTHRITDQREHPIAVDIPVAPRLHPLRAYLYDTHFAESHFGSPDWTCSRPAFGVSDRSGCRHLLRNSDSRYSQVATREHFSTGPSN
jgi:hypothetical protein